VQVDWMKPEYWPHDLEVTSLGKIKYVSNTQAAEQTLKIFRPPLDNLRVGSVILGLSTASPLNHSTRIMHSFPPMHTTQRPLQRSRSLIQSTNYIYCSGRSFVCWIVSTPPQQGLTNYQLGSSD